MIIFNDELYHLLTKEYESLDYGLKEIYDALTKISFGRLKAIRKNTVSMKMLKILVKKIRDDSKEENK